MYTPSPPLPGTPGYAEFVAYRAERLKAAARTAVAKGKMPSPNLSRAALKKPLTELGIIDLNAYIAVQICDWPTRLTNKERHQLTNAMFASVVKMRSMSSTFEQREQQRIRCRKIRKQKEEAERKISQPHLDVINVSINHS